MFDQFGDSCDQFDSASGPGINRDFQPCHDGGIQQGLWAKFTEHYVGVVDQFSVLLGSPAIVAQTVGTPLDVALWRCQE
ncbi:hypothetical protein D3C76_1469570 [compost metagenome]